MLITGKPINNRGHRGTHPTECRPMIMRHVRDSFINSVRVKKEFSGQGQTPDFVSEDLCGI